MRSPSVGVPSAWRLARHAQADPDLRRRGGGGLRRERRPRRLGPRQRPALGVGHVHPRQHREVLQRLHALGAHGRAGRRRERDERLEQREPVRVVVDAVHERAVELQDVGRDADDLLQARVAVARVVERDPRAAGAQRVELAVERRLGREQLVLRELDDDPREVLRQHGAHLVRDERARAHVEGEERPLRPAARPQRGAQRGRLERRAEPDAVRLVEPLVGRPERAVGHPGERLVAGDAARGQLEHRLEERDDRVLARQQRLDLGPLPVAGELAGEPAVVAARLVAAGALGEVERAVGELEQPRGLVRVLREGGDAGRAGERRRRRPGRPRSPRAPARRPPRRRRRPRRGGSGRTPPRRGARPCRRRGPRRAARAATSMRTLSPSAWP